ncbi:MAG: hypothetical protein AAGG68_26120 [Bacteroidota bacterium]
MKTFYLLLIFLFVGMFSLEAAPYAAAPHQDKTALEKEELTAKKTFKEKFKDWSAKRKVKREKRAEKFKAKLAKYASPGKGGVRLGLVIVLIGALIAVLGLAGVANILITVGLIVLVVGVAIWLIDAIL